MKKKIQPGKKTEKSRGNENGNKKIILVAAIAVAVAVVAVSAFFLFNQNAAPAWGAQRFGHGGNFSNLTPEQRQAMQWRNEAVSVACNGKAEGDACAVQSSQSMLNGTCKMLRSNLSCVPIGFQLPQNRTWRQ